MTTHSRYLIHAARLCIAASIALFTLGGAREARASSDYPPALAAALDQEFPGVTHCVPLCTACHNTTQGGPKNINAFGTTLKKYELLPGNPALVDIAIQGLKAANPPDDSDGDGVSDIDEINAGDSPSLPGAAGTSQFCPNIAYGCGARIATRPPADRVSLFGLASVALGLVSWRRRRTRVHSVPSRKRTSF
ncbi:MAG TPA: hypothetical protein VGM44_16440 [Polyangiaceae bacterium]|jgi:cytochrome c5